MVAADRVAADPEHRRAHALLVHSQDAGGVLPPKVPVVERVLAGMREALTDDDQPLRTAAGVFEGLCIAFNDPNP